MNKEKIREDYTVFIGRNKEYRGLVPFNKIPEIFYDE